ncbi:MULTISPECIES: amidase [Photorhabdus]|uniref:Amidase domain-containing protein n=3 Tax=Photorhabdus TaxID=29487 RepID=A0A0F7LLH3_9GAMM|nr:MULTISPECIES: amidase [Photorhabdus]AKH62736.1 hypothetical protein VY86_04685 [Photorhabdus thracensis]EQC01332.1 hypothetical protein B738_05076 [Photorhabdus temperata subsp. temperata M1021]KER04575.1 amidase, Asp-tRNAAsn/Glu-tRNAGln amidotransferase A subunit [Photorhabdus temperata subsp. temperata Meg1]MCT8345696.1 amidase [Photorhabdus temperata]
MKDELVHFPVMKLGQLISKGEISPVDVVEAYLERIARLDGELHAFVEVYDAESRHSARQAEREITAGRYCGPLHGIPIAVKDFFDVEGTVTSGGTKCFTKRAQTTAPVVRALQDYGMILIGKHRAVELGMGAAGIVETGPTPLNPWKPDLRIAAGGSSNGSAVAVAAGLIPVALATDTGGSVRIPAAWCGVCGFRPSSGQLSLKGVLPLSQTMDTVGIIAKETIDVELIYNHLYPQETLKEISEPVKIALLPLQERMSLCEESALHYQALLNLLPLEEFQILRISLPISLSQCMKANSQITAFEAWHNYGYLCKPGSGLGEKVIMKLERGNEVKETEYLRASLYCHQIRQAFSQWFRKVDALVIPTTPEPAWPLEENEKHTPPNDFTRFVNFADLCAVAIPTGLNHVGLPQSVQIICKKGDERKALLIAGMIERRIGFSDTARGILLKAR